MFYSCKYADITLNYSNDHTALKRVKVLLMIVLLLLTIALKQQLTQHLDFWDS